ncbi:MAG: ribonuclease E/G, partial [Actinomycetota bacterium]
MTNEFGESERLPVELPDPPREGRPSIPPPPGRAFRAAETRGAESPDDDSRDGDTRDGDTRERGSRDNAPRDNGTREGGGRNRRRRRGGRNRNRGGRDRNTDRADRTSDRRSHRSPEEIDAELIALPTWQGTRRTAARSIPHVRARAQRPTQVAVLEGRSLIEHYVSRPADDVYQIHGNIYLGKVQNVLPGMEAAFVDIATPKNAVLYRGDVQFDKEDVVEQGPEPRIEHVLKRGQLILCQVTKNPIGEKGAR